jgi:hypothetical protein
MQDLTPGFALSAATKGRPYGYRSDERYRPPNKRKQIEVSAVTSARRVKAAKRNVKRAQQAARRKRTIARLPKSTRSELGKEAARGRQRGGEAGHALDDRNRRQLYEIAKDRNISGRSKMGEWDLIKAIRKAR